MPLDTLIRNATVVDGTGKPRYGADVGISRGRIEAVGSLQERRRRMYTGPDRRRGFYNEAAEARDSGAGPA